MSMEGLKFQTLSAEGIFAQKARACAHSVVNISACVTSHLLEKGAVRSSLNEFVHFHSRMAYNRIKQIFEALEARDAVLLNEIIESMNGSERASVLFRRERSDDKDYVCCSQATDRWVSRKLRPIKRYVSSAFPDSKSPLVTAVKNGDLDSVKVLFKPFREGLLLSAVNGNTDILRYFIEKKR